MQGGNIRTDQMAACGFGASWINYQVSSGFLVRVHRGVYAVGHAPTEPLARAWAATLAAGDDSALAGRSAASFYGVHRDWREPLEVLVPGDRRIPGLKIRRSSTLLTRDVWRVDGLRVTSPARTALDLATELTDKRLHGAVDHLRLRHKLKRHQIAELLDRNPKHPGAGRLRRIAGLLTENPSRSGFEREWAAFAERFGLPPSQLNAQVAGHEADVLIDGRLIVELDTVATHLLNFESDRRRDAEVLARTGIPTLRVTWETSHDDPPWAADQILTVLGRAGVPDGQAGSLRGARAGRRPRC